MSDAANVLLACRIAGVELSIDGEDVVMRGREVFLAEIRPHLALCADEVYALLVRMRSAIPPATLAELH